MTELYHKKICVITQLLSPGTDKNLQFSEERSPNLSTFLLTYLWTHWKTVVFLFFLSSYHLLHSCLFILFNTCNKPTQNSTPPKKKEQSIFHSCCLLLPSLQISQGIIYSFSRAALHRIGLTGLVWFRWSLLIHQSIIPYFRGPDEKLFCLLFNLTFLLPSSLKNSFRLVPKPEK